MKHHIINWAMIFLLAWASHCISRDLIDDFCKWWRDRK